MARHEEHGERRGCRARRLGALPKAHRHLADLQGPKIRTGPLEDGQPYVLRPGAAIHDLDGDCLGDSTRRFDHLSNACPPKCSAAIAFCWPTD